MLCFGLHVASAVPSGSQRYDLGMLEALLGAVVGGVLTALGTYVVTSSLDRRGREHFAREQRLLAAREALGALQELNRRLIDVARVDTTGHGDKPWQELHRATIRWNTARLAAALIAPSEEVDLLLAIDHETDVVMDKALSQRWDSREFRAERESLGLLGGRYLNLVRTNEGLPKINIESLWAWSERRQTVEAREEPVLDSHS